MIHEKLIAVQKALKAPKNQKNTFGGYNYRSCEDILEAVKPLLVKEDLLLTLSDTMVEVGGRVYVKATATVETGEEEITVTAFAREEEEKKGMDASQITGAASSYARKYALNGLFCIDDTKDSDFTNTHGKEDAPKKKTTELKPEPAEFECQYCHTPITKAEHEYSLKTYGYSLCRTHQDLAKKKGVKNG